jgi:hypothetical protein
VIEAAINNEWSYHRTGPKEKLALAGGTFPEPIEARRMLIIMEEATE